MNTPNPLSPQGSLLEKQAKSKSSLQAAALIVGVHVFVLGGLLILGCSKEDKKVEPPVTDSFSNPGPIGLDTNAPVLGGMPTNGLPTGGGLAITSQPPVGLMPPATIPTVITDPPSASVAAASGSEYKIQKGDIAYNLAKKNGVSLKALKEANPNVDIGKLKVGQTIQIPGGSVLTKTEHAGVGKMEASVSGETTTYTVKGGDNLIKIAKKHGTSVKALRAANDLKSSDIKVGQKLKVPAKAAAAEPIPAPIPNATPAGTGLPTATPVAIPK